MQRGSQPSASAPRQPAVVLRFGGRVLCCAADGPSGSIGSDANLTAPVVDMPIEAGETTAGDVLDLVRNTPMVRADPVLCHTKRRRRMRLCGSVMCMGFSSRGAPQT